MSGVSYNREHGGLMYAPARDFAYNYPVMIRCIRDAFSREYWPGLLRLVAKASIALPLTDEEYAAAEQAAWDDLERANLAFTQFINISCQDSSETFDDVCARSGWNDVPEPARMGWLAMLGTVMMGQLFQGLRDVTKEGVDAPSCAASLLRSGHKARCSSQGIDRDAEREHDLSRLMALGRKLRDAGMSASDLVDAFEEGLRD